MQQSGPFWLGALENKNIVYMTINSSAVHMIIHVLEVLTVLE